MCFVNEIRNIPLDTVDFLRDIPVKGQIVGNRTYPKHILITSQYPVPRLFHFIQQIGILLMQLLFSIYKTVMVYSLTRFYKNNYILMCSMNEFKNIPNDTLV